MKTLTMMTLLSLSSAALAVEPQQVDLYLKATRGEAGAAANAYASFNQSLAVDAADPLTLLYAGSARTLMAREAREPTTAGRYTQEGVALIRQALAASGAEQLERQHQGMREGDYINAIAAATLTSLPEFFGTRSQGLALFEALLADHFRDHMGGGFALGGEVGGQNHLLHHAIAGALHQLVQAYLFRANAIERAQPPHQHKVKPLERPRALQRRLIGRCLDHAQPRGIALRVQAGAAHLGLGERVAARAMAHALHGMGQRGAGPRQAGQAAGAGR